MSPLMRRGRLYRVGWTVITGCPEAEDPPPGALSVDLRGLGEMTPLPDAVSIPVDVPGAVAGLGSRPGSREYQALYAETVDLCGKEIAGVVEAVAGTDAPVVVGCSLGKDRTGLVIAVIGLLAGVAEEEVLAEDVRARAGILGCAPAVRVYAAARGGVDELSRRCLLDDSALRFALAHMRARYGGVEQYVLGHGVSPAVVAGLRRSLREA
ncbi:tyrosine-protein phosphatase [Lentzea sp.]|uniref:tyrosine-protein phosphatase n=1 Tax=Lentzea sp. TaxID=56099 RepID=UPI002B819EA4|nr:tyrosine-protein phosphatase [Lentzea sp.]HUQ56445.1 tyrosine-protein phosphatase [Lentzea sp.]